MRLTNKNAARCHENAPGMQTGNEVKQNRKRIRFLVGKRQISLEKA